MNINNKFLAIMLGDEDTDFNAIFEGLTDEEQNQFLDLLAKFNTKALELLKDAPRETKIEAMAVSVDSMPLEMRQAISTVLTDDWFGIDGRGGWDLINEVIFQKKEEAELVLRRISEIIAMMNYATCSDVKELIGMDTNMQDTIFGWTTLEGAVIQEVAGGYSLNLPHPKVVVV